MDNLQFIERYEEILRQRGTPKMQMYRDCGITDAAVSQWRQGKTSPSNRSINKIASYLGVTPEWLKTGIGNEKPATDKDDELNAYLEELRTRPEMRMLFKLSKGATKEEVEQAVKIIEALRKK